MSSSGSYHEMTLCPSGSSTRCEGGSVPFHSSSGWHRDSHPRNLMNLSQCRHKFPFLRIRNPTSIKESTIYVVAFRMASMNGKPNLFLYESFSFRNLDGDCQAEAAGEFVGEQLGGTRDRVRLQRLHTMATLHTPCQL